MKIAWYRSAAVIMPAVCFAVAATSAKAVVLDDDLPTAEALLDGHIEATGGKDAYLSIKTRVRAGTFSSDIGGHSLQAKIVEQTKAPNKSHLMFDGDQLGMVRVCNGKEAWEWNAGHRHGSGEEVSDSALPENTQLMTGPEKSMAVEKAHFHADVQWRDRFKEVKTVGLVNVDGKPSFEVQVTTNTGEQYSQFFDKDNGRRIKVSRTVESSQMGSVDMEMFLRDYKEFDGLWLPTELHQVVEIPGFGSGTQTWTYSRIQHNVDVPDSIFKMPDEIRERIGK